MALVLVTLAQAHTHLRLPFTLNVSPVDPRQADLELKAEQAEGIILDYCNTTQHWRDITPGWDVGSPITVPRQVQAAVLLMLTHLWEHRGDDLAPDENLWAAIGRLLARTRDPVVA